MPAADQVLRFLSRQAGYQDGRQGPFIDEAAANSELANSSRNLALAHFLKDFGNLEWVGLVSLALSVIFAMIGITRFYQLKRQLASYYEPLERDGDEEDEVLDQG